jgi:quercetin dioxygenase-like cupin family protein
MISGTYDGEAVPLDPPRQSTQHPPSDASTYSRDGYFGPVQLYTPAQCSDLVRHVRLDDCPQPLDWAKGRAATDRHFYDLATHPRLLAILKQLLGENIILWGASVIEREPAEAHPWHADRESAEPAGRFVSVWIGIENTSRDAGLRLIARSHISGKTIQEFRRKHGVARERVSDEQALAWARSLEPEASIVQPDVGDGQGIVFDGGLWHASGNTTKDFRTALLLQYAAAGTEVRIPDPAQLDWPFKFTALRPPVVLVSGRDETSVNRMVPPPASLSSGQGAISAEVRPLTLPLAENRIEGWQPYPILDGPTAILQSMSYHVSVLSPGHSPHPPHAHPGEEILIVLEGEAEVLIGDGPKPEEARVESLSAGSFVYYPAFRHHTIRNADALPVTYAMFNWRSAVAEPGPPDDAEIVHFGQLPTPDDSAGFSTQILFEHPTSHLDMLHAHLTDLQPGAGYPAHSDDYDVAMLLLSGKVQALGRVVEPYGLIYCSAGEPHDMSNVGDKAARYLVFEFHAANPLDPQLPWAKERRVLLAKLQKLQRQCDDHALARERLVDSTSWRLTAPLRAASVLLRRWKPRKSH